MPIYTDEYIYTTIHDFKSNISRYLREIEKGSYRAVIVNRYNKPAGIFVPYVRRMEEARREAKNGVSSANPMS